MNMNTVRMEALNESNYDTWQMKMQVLLIKNDAWEYVNEEVPKPTVAEGNIEPTSLAAMKRWEQADRKAMSDIILLIWPSEIKQVKECTTAHEVWLKLKEIYQSKGPARIATLLKQLILHRMQEGQDIHEDLHTFFNATDKLKGKT